MKWAIKILPVELKKDPNVENYLLKYRAYTFQLRVELFDDLHTIFMKGFEEELRRYSKEDLEEQNAIVINEETYLGHKGYGIHKESKIQI